MMAAGLAQGIATTDLENLVGARYAQRRTGLQEIDIAVKRIGVGFENCHHRLVHRQTAVRTHALRDAPQCIASFYVDIAAAHGVIRRIVDDGLLSWQRRLCRNWRLHGLGTTRRWRSSSFDTATIGRSRTSRRRNGRRGLRRRRRRECRWVEQNRVLAQQATTCPACFDEECQERFDHR